MSDTIDAAALDALRASNAAFALFDIRDPVEAERGHVAGSTVLPRRSIEERIAGLVADRSTPIVVVDDASGRASLASATLRRLGYANVRWLDGGIQAWRSGGHALATGTNVPSKRFGERTHHALGVPSIDISTYLRWRSEGRDVLLCDVRPPGEYERATIPGSTNGPGFDVVLGLDALREHEAVVIHCAGRTRSIVGTQTLRDLGIEHAFALENGTMGWTLAGESLERDARRVLPLAAPGDAVVAERSRALAASCDVTRIDAVALASLLAEERRNHQVFDVRATSAYEAGHVPGTRSVPGGQLIQRTDDFVAVRSAPIVLVDEGEGRAEITATWLRRMGLPDVSVLDGGVHAWHDSALVTGREPRHVLGLDAADAEVRTIGPDGLAVCLGVDGEAIVLDVDTSVRYAAGHVPGAHWMPRGWMELRIDAVAPSREAPVLVTCSDGRQSLLAAATLQSLGYRHVRVLADGKRGWAASGRALSTADLAPQDDVARPPYARGRQAMLDYLAWETALVDPHDPASPEDPPVRSRTS